MADELIPISPVRRLTPICDKANESIGKCDYSTPVESLPPVASTPTRLTPIDTNRKDISVVEEFRELVELASSKRHTIELPKLSKPLSAKVARRKSLESYIGSNRQVAVAAEVCGDAAVSAISILSHAVDGMVAATAKVGRALGETAVSASSTTSAKRRHSMEARAPSVDGKSSKSDKFNRRPSASEKLIADGRSNKRRGSVEAPKCRPDAREVVGPPVEPSMPSLDALKLTNEDSNRETSQDMSAVSLQLEILSVEQAESHQTGESTEHSEETLLQRQSSMEVPASLQFLSSLA